METKLAQLKSLLIEASNLEAAARLLAWDRNTYMPPGGGPARGRQIATLRQLAHEKWTDPQVGRLLDDLGPYAESQPYESDEAGLVRVARRLYDRLCHVPSWFMADFYGHTSVTYEAWSQARPENDFGRVLPYLKKTLDLSRQYSGYFSDQEHVADPLIALQDYGMKATTVRDLFAQLRQELVPLVQTITAQPAADDACLRQGYPPREQLAFALEIVRQFGYDLERGRMDETPHPFTTYFSIGDVRITTRVQEHDLSEALFSTMHESGHAMYEQGICQDYEGTPLARGTSSGMHESQSRLWENIVGRSRRFWEGTYPRLQATFSQQLGDVSLDTFHRAVNRVSRSLIRTDADEVTYNLHVLLRFDLELDLLEGTLTLADLPEAWRARMEADLGIVPPDDRDGVLQDVHWYTDFIGGQFQGYTLGNIISGQIYAAALAAHPEIEDEMAQGAFGTLHGWLVENVYRHGRKFTADELITRVTGRPLSIEPYVRYLKTKYGALYEL